VALAYAPHRVAIFRRRGAGKTRYSEQLQDWTELHASQPCDIQPPTMGDVEGMEFGRMGKSTWEFFGEQDLGLMQDDGMEVVESELPGWVGLRFLVQHGGPPFGELGGTQAQLKETYEVFRGES
jgi:hypothetical protein